VSATRDLATALQLLLPHRLLSRIVYYATRWRFKPWKSLLIGSLRRAYGISLAEAAIADPREFEHFNAFFTRELKPGARPIASGVIVSPADGKVSQSGPISDGRIVQAKGIDFSIAELLGDAAEAGPFDGGQFATIYLSPRDYHRVHMPLAGVLRRSIHVPGRLFSVAPWTAEAIPRLYARNERLCLLFDTEQGPLALIFVGAIFVSSIQTVFEGEVTPPYASRIRIRDHDRERAPRFATGEEVGRFNMGSTVIVLLPKGAPPWREFAPETPIKMGEALTTPTLEITP
jgi:phosphatidylserine decarboxylase